MGVQIDFGPLFSSWYLMERGVCRINCDGSDIVQCFLKGMFILDDDATHGFGAKRFVG